ncbi:MAG: YhdP family protein [Burkholderiales bacterium]
MSSAIADVNLVNVRARALAEQVPLSLTHLSGRLQWSREGSATRVSASNLTLETADGVMLPPLSVSFRQDSAPGRHSELTLAEAEIEPLSRLAGLLPVSAEVTAKIAAAQPTGTISSARVVWSADQGSAGPYAVQAEFKDLALKPIEAFPGVHRLSGNLEATERGGTVSLRAQRGVLELPKVFVAPLPLDFFATEADWRYEAAQFTVSIRSASFTNEHLAGNLSGPYTSSEQGAGNADFSAVLVRGEAREVWRYVPNLAPGTRDWLKRALLSGRATDVRARLSGPLDKFPFVDGKSGVFEVVANAQDVTLDYANGWPPLEGVAGEVAIRGNRMEISPRTARLLGMDVSKTQARIPGLGGHEEHLLIKGELSAAAQDFLRFVSVSPVAGYTGQFTENMSGVGQGQLALELDLPLHDVKDVRVSGRLALSGASLNVDPRVPALTNYSARIDFSESGVSVKNATAQLLGGQLRFDAANRKDGSLTIGLGGRLDVAELAKHVNHPLLYRLQGSTDWRGALSLRKKVAQLRLESDLVGIASRLPAPMAKAPETALPAKFEIYERPNQQQLISFALGAIGSAQLLYEGGKVSRGMVNFGGQAALPNSDVVAVAGSLAALDIDAWQTALRDDTRAGTDAVSLPLNSLNVRVGALDVSGRRFSDLRISAVRSEDTWRLTLDGREGRGEATWAAGNGGRLTARFSSLVVPPAASEVLASRPEQAAGQMRDRLPAFDVVADNFTFEEMSLGRLELLADPDAKSWRLERLAVINPDGRLELSGSWAVTDLPRTELRVKIDASNIGRLFTRFGYPEGIKGGRGTLSGPVSWVGSPYHPDLPTLSGQLKLEAKDGRFAKLEPGVAKLLGILSLQSLPRRISLDFRDLFSAGFSFDTISAEATVASGVAQTEDFQMVGSSARVSMKGRISLADETQDLQVRIYPKLSTAAAVAGAVVNPALGVASLIVQKALGDPFESLASLDYRVTGSWSDPIVERVSRKPEGSESRK